MKKILVLAAFVGVASMARATEMAIYPNFAEVRETVQLNGERFDWTPPADLGQYLQPDSLELNDSNVLFMSLLPPTPSLLEMFEGKEIKVLYEGDYINAIVVSARLKIFKIDNAYVEIPQPMLQFPNLDGWRNAQTYSWRRNNVPQTATLQYRTDGVSWKQSKYTLNLESANSIAKLTGWAEIENESSVDYKSTKAALYAGFVSLAQSNSTEQHRTPPIVASQPSRPITFNPTPVVKNSSELGGLQKFEYAGAFELGRRSTLNLPFAKSQPVVNQVLEYYNYLTFNPVLIRPLQRTYRFFAPVNLPAGNFTVRENGQLLGQDFSPDTAKGSRVRLDLGNDFDINLKRTAKLLERRRTRTLDSDKYQINFSIKNTKTRAVQISVSERGCNNWILTRGTGRGLRLVKGGFVLETELKPGETLRAAFFASQTIVKNVRGVTTPILPC